jgi:hypothetical protein
MQMGSRDPLDRIAFFRPGWPRQPIRSDLPRQQAAFPRRSAMRIIAGVRIAHA